MARCLIIGCGCRGLTLAERLRGDGHAVRGTTRDRVRADVIAAAGVEAYVADPDRVATLGPALEHVTVACILLGSAVAAGDGVAALHGPRLQTLLRRSIDTTVRGILYEAAGSVDADILGRGARRVAATCEESRIAYALLRAGPDDHVGWVAAAHRAISDLLGTGVAAR